MGRGILNDSPTDQYLPSSQKGLPKQKGKTNIYIYFWYNGRFDEGVESLQYLSSNQKKAR